MFELQDIRKSRAWQETYQEGLEKGIEKGSKQTNQQHVQLLLAKGMALKEIADLLGMPLAEARRLAKHPG